MIRINIHHPSLEFPPHELPGLPRVGDLIDYENAISEQKVVLLVNRVIHTLVTDIEGNSTHGAILKCVTFS